MIKVLFSFLVFLIAISSFANPAPSLKEVVVAYDMSDFTYHFWPHRVVNNEIILMAQDPSCPYIIIHKDYRHVMCWVGNKKIAVGVLGPKIAQQKSLAGLSVHWFKNVEVIQVQRPYGINYALRLNSL